MTRKEIEKAIENGESVWCLYCNEVYEIEIKNHTNRFINKNGNEDMYNYTDENGTDRCFPIKALYKSKAEAEHYLHHANVVRTEELPFLTWEEFLKNREIIFTTKKYETVMLGILNNKLILAIRGKSSYNYWDLTEANFYKAYDECARLFKEQL